MILFTPLVFYTNEEEFVFFSWLKKINCIEKIEGSEKNLYIFIKSECCKDGNFFLSFEEWRDFRGLFHRYNFNYKRQLKKIKVVDDRECLLYKQEYKKRKKKRLL